MIVIKKQANKNVKNATRVSPIAAGVAGAAAGAAVGAGVAVAATQAMKNEKTRKQIKNVMRKVQKQAAEYAGSLKKDGIKEGKKSLNKVIASAKKGIDAKASITDRSKNKRVSVSRGSRKNSPRPSSHA